MKKKLTEPGRTKPHGPPKDSRAELKRELKKYQHYEDEDGEGFEFVAKKSAKKSRGHGSKYFTDNFAPIRRFLEKNVGRPWDKVYSEMCKDADLRSLEGWHFRLHIDDLIDTNVEIDEKGFVYSRNGFYSRYPLWKGRLYVHPESGLVCEVKKGPTKGKRFSFFSKQEEKEQTKIKLEDDYWEYLEKIDGIWYFIHNEAIQKQHYDGSFYTANNQIKKQLSSNLLKHYGLKNNP